jgi:hypothetical protein
MWLFFIFAIADYIYIYRYILYVHIVNVVKLPSRYFFRRPGVHNEAHSTTCILDKQTEISVMNNSVS